LLVVGGCAASAVSQEIVIIAGDSLTYTSRTISGAKRAISTQHEQARYYEIYLNPAESDDQKCADSIRGLNPSLILTVGSAATRFAQKNFPNTPIVFSAVMYPARGSWKR
jgi:hypothetical protein